MPRAVDLDARKVSTSVLGRKKIEENKENAVSIEKLANLEIQDEKQSESSHVEKRKTQLLGHALDNPDLSGLVKRAERLERDRQYGKALKLYRRLLEQHVDVREKVKSVEAQAKVVKANGGWYPNEQTSHHELPGASERLIASRQYSCNVSIGHQQAAIYCHPHYIPSFFLIKGTESSGCGNCMAMRTWEVRPKSVLKRFAECMADL